LEVALLSREARTLWGALLGVVPGPKLARPSKKWKANRNLMGQRGQKQWSL